MRNIESWKPTRIKIDKVSGKFVLDERKVYQGSLHMARLQFVAYIPLLEKYCSGKLLDAGCGQVPYYELLHPKVSVHYCVDRSEDAYARSLLDEVVDLNKSVLLMEKDFDTILLTDVIAHIQQPWQLVKDLAQHLVPGGHLFITTPFVYWQSEFPHEYYHPSGSALQKMCADAGLEILVLEPYGGRADVLLDTLNKGMISPFFNRCFRVLASVVKKTSWYKKTNEKTRYSYPIGYTLVARKP